MDKIIRPALQWLFKNRFWVTCTLVAVVSLATWYMAWSKIEKDRDDRAGKLKSKKSKIANVISSDVATGVGEEAINVHPNDGTAKGMEERISLAADGALEAWTERYAKQRDLMQYAGVLPRQIRDPLANHEPMEKPIEGGELLDETQRETFALEIPKHMPTLAAKIQATWGFDASGLPKSEIEQNNDKKGRGKKGRGSGKNRTPRLAVVKDLVVWDETNQELWNTKTTQFGFFGNQDPQNRPNSQQALALSQDLWILGGIFDVIANVNKGFTANDLAPIERVDHVLVGRDAINDSGELGQLTEFSYKPPITVGATAKKMRKGLVSKRERNRARSQSRSSQAAKKSAQFDPGASKSPFHGRYVDRDFSQLNEKEITDVITSKTLSPQSYLAVAKRVPVRIAVKMDERRINEFLAAAANSPFAFEIRQVRVNKHDPSEVKELKGEAGAGGGKKDERGKLGLGGGMGGGNQADSGGSGRRRGGVGADEGFLGEGRTNFDVKVEFVGIVKIYNPVNRDLFFPEEDKNADGTPKQ